MGTVTDPKDYYLPSQGESGPSWGPKLVESMVKINNDVHALEDSVDAETVARSSAITAVQLSVTTETTNRTNADTANLITATGRAAALALIFGG